MSECGTLTVVTHAQTLRIPCETDRTVLEMLMDNGITDISSPCGGNGLCGKCLVQVVEGNGGTIHGDEKRLLTPDQLEAGLRMACRMRVGKGSNLTIKLAQHRRGRPSGRQLRCRRECERYRGCV